MAKIRIDPAVYIWAAVLLFFIPVRWLLAAFMAAAAHESAHILMLKWLKCDVKEIRIGFFGASIQTGPLTDREELISALAGPAGSFLMILLYRILPAAALCAFVQGLFNLLPLYPLDGGRAVRCAVRILWPSSDRLLRLIQLTAFLLIGIGLCAMCVISGLTVLLPVVLMICIRRSVLRKRPCKQDKLALQ